MDYSPPGSSVYGISQARILEWAAISFSKEPSEPGMEPVSPTLQADSFFFFFFAGRFLYCLGHGGNAYIK